GGREMVRKAVVDEIAAAKAGGEERAHHPPVIRRGALGLADPPGRDEHAPRFAPARCREAAERAVVLLQLEQVRLARDRSACDCASSPRASPSTSAFAARICTQCARAR